MRMFAASVAIMVVSLASDAASAQSAGQRLLVAYPDHIAAVEGNDLVWKDGARMVIDDGLGAKYPDARVARADLKDMLLQPYPAGDWSGSPAEGSDPGRARNAAFFAKMYGDCSKGEVARNLVEVVWLPKKAGQKLKVTRINGVAERLTAISEALDQLPARFDVYLKPSAGTYVCRPIAGTSQASGHGYGIAIDIATRYAHYWRWSKGGASAYRNSIPPEIVRIFEANGFIWGGKWWHYDTMHFEYRPELLPLRATP